MGHQIEVAFENKHSAKDGPSAAVACALLLDSAISGEKLRPLFATTGDLNADGSVQPIGGLAAKIRAAQSDGCKILAVPSKNIADLRDAVIIEGPGFLAEIPIFSIRTFEEAKEVAIHSEGRNPIDTALEEFSMIRDLHRRSPEGFSKSLSHPAVRAKLTSIQEAAPNLASATLLLQIADETYPERMSLKGSVTWVDELTGDLLRGARASATSRSTSFQSDGLADAIAALTARRQQIDSRCIPYSDALVDLGRLLRKYIQNPPAPGTSANNAINSINQAIARVDAAREAILKDAEMMSELLD